MDIVKVAMLNGKELKFIGDNRFVDVENNRMKFNHSKNTYYNGETKKLEMSLIIYVTKWECHLLRVLSTCRH